MLIYDTEREKDSKMIAERGNSSFKGRNSSLFFSTTPIAAKEITGGLVPNKIIAFENMAISASTELLDKLF